MKKHYLLFFLILLTACDSGKEPQAEKVQAPPPMPVQVMAPKQEMLSLTRVFTGRFVPIERVDLRARVSGFITEIHFSEGQTVQKGDTLVTIDPDLYQSAFDAAEAKLAQADAELSLAEKNLERAASLLESRSISQEEVDSRAARVAVVKADRSFAAAELEQTKLNLSYTKITAPISGRIGIQQITTGNYISGGSSTAPILATIIPQSPLYFEFEIDERQARKSIEIPSGKVAIAVSDETDFSTEGEVVFRNNQLAVSAATLTIRVKVKNEEGNIIPGAFGKVKLPISAEKERLTVLETALGFEQSRRFAWVIGKDNIPEKRYVEPGELLGHKRIIVKGLTPEDQVAISGIQMIRPGMPVQPIAAEESAPSETR